MTLSHAGSGWTGGQYSLFRGALATYLAVHFAALLPWATELFSSRGVLPQASASPLTRAFPNILTWFDSPAVVMILLLVAIAAAIALAIGWRDRTAALVLWYIWASLFGRNPLISNPSIPFVGWLLLAHLFVPKAPYGSVAASGRTDPGGGWSMPRSLFNAAWVVMAVAYSYSGYTKLISPSWVDGSALRHVLDNPLARPGFLRETLLGLPDPLLAAATWTMLAVELLFAPLALLRRARPWLWSLMVVMHVGIVLFIDFADLSLGMLVFHLFTFDPAWIPRYQPTAQDWLYYDGHCGLCHRAVRFALAEDIGQAAFRYVPLDSETFLQRLDANARSNLADSVVIETVDGQLLQRSAAILHLCARLGGLWRVASWLMRLIPRRLRDVAYDQIAAVRHRLFQRPDQACPIVPPHLRDRFRW